MPFKTFERTLIKNNKSNSVKKNLKMNSRVYNTTQNNDDNFSFLLNKIEPYLIKKFKNQNGQSVYFKMKFFEYIYLIFYIYYVYKDLILFLFI